METYENDKDISGLIYFEITEEKLLDFFFKKWRPVNINNLAYLISAYGKNKNFSEELLKLESKGLIKSAFSFHYKLTIKAKWEKFRDSKTTLFILILLGVIAAFLAIK